MDLKTIFTNEAPAPGGHYSQAIVHNGMVYVAGQLPIDPVTGNKVFGTIQEQTERVLKNIEAILITAGSSKQCILKTTVYITDINEWSAVNAVYERFFGSHKPARAVVPVNTLHYGFKIEIEAIAALETENT